MVKKCIFISLVTIESVIAGFGADNVFTETVNGLEWTYRVADGEAELYSQNDERTIDKSTFGAVTIPQNLGGYLVKRIGDRAFAGCNAVTFIDIPESVVSIGTRAFQDCSGLMSLILPDGLEKIDGMAFYCCSGLSRVVIPDSVTYIGDGAFPGCSTLTDVVLSKNLKEIPSGCFSGDGRLSNIVIPDGVTNIANQVFYDCRNLKTIEIPSSVRSVGAIAFHYAGLTQLVVPGSITSIGSGAFECLDCLTNLVIESGVPGIAPSMFRSCTRLESVLIPESATTIGNGAFCSCRSMKNISLASATITIGNSAFEDCGSIEEVTIPATVRIVGGYAFKDCKSLKSVKFLGNAPIADEITFENVNADCTAYVKRSSTGWNVDIPGEWMGIKIAYFDPAIYTIVLDANGGSLGEAADEIAFGEGEVMRSLPVPERENYAFLGWYTDAEGGTRVAEGSVVTANMTLYAHWQQATPVLTIADGVLVGVALNGGTRIEIPDGVKIIADDAFVNCAGLESVSIPNSVTSMTFAAFSRCDKLWTKWYMALANGVMPNAVDLTVTNVVVHYVTQSVPSAAVVPPIAAGIVNVVSEVNAGAAVAITADWAAQYPGFEAKFGNDFTKAITAETGKRDGAGMPMMVWQDFVAGTDPTNPDDVFKASITFDAVTGNPIVSWTPELPAAEAAKRAYKTFGKVRLNDPDWTLIDGDAANYNFFKVSVQMK